MSMLLALPAGLAAVAALASMRAPDWLCHVGGLAASAFAIALLA